VILVHDTMNAEVRAGIESTRLDEHERVVYWEPDFVAGYVYREGAARGTAWGGLGLVLTDAARSPDYLESARQTLYEEPYEAVQRLREGGSKPAGRSMMPRYFG
jgi:hypothetical protein